MTHGDIVAFFGNNKEASIKIGCVKSAISNAKHRRLSTPIQIRAFHISNGKLQMDSEAKAHFDFLLAKDCQKAA